MNQNIIFVGDMHLRECLGYDSYIEGGRDAEEQEVLDFIVEQSADCDTVIMLGDQFNARNNTSNVIKKFVRFLERFIDKKVYILKGNHCYISSEKSALDFLQEIKGKHWEVITNAVTKIGDIVFCPYFTKADMEVETNEEATKKLSNTLPEGKILAVHHAISGSVTEGGAFVSFFNEIVLPVEIAKKYDYIFAGHIHKPQRILGNIIVTGSIFNNEVNETGKFIYKYIPQLKNPIKEIALPGRGVYKIENPTSKDLMAISSNSIVKTIITDKKVDIEEISKELERFDAHLLLEQYPRERSKMAFDSDKSILELSMPQLLEIYAKQNNLELPALLRGWQLIN